MQTLDPYQEAGARFLAVNKKAFLGDEPGEVGKTLQAIRACDMVGARTVLVICPLSVVENWKRYFKNESLLDPTVEVHTSGAIAAGAWLKDHYDVVILDEAHYVKNAKSARTRAFYGEDCDGGEDSIVAKAPYVFLLSGSPAPNHPGELWTHLHALRPDLIQGPKGTLPSSRFTNIYCRVRMTPFGPKVEGVRHSKVDKLKAILSEFMLRRDKGFFVLPELSVEPLYVEPGISLTGASEDMEAAAKALAKGGLTALKELSTSHANLRRLLGLAKIQPTIDYVRDWLNANDGKIVVYAWHSEVVDRLVKAFEGKVASIQGSTKNRQAQVDMFQEDDTCRVFVGQMQAAGEAITLTRASATLLVEPSWVPKDNRQTIKRVHRRGQTKPVLALFVTVAGSVDEAINKALRSKEETIDAVFGE